jgi:predicted transcriptional regulator
MLNETITVKLLNNTGRLTLTSCRVHKELVRRLGETSDWVDYQSVAEELGISYDDVKRSVTLLVQAGVLTKGNKQLTIIKEFVL